MSAEPVEPRIPVQLSMDDPEPMYRQIESQLRDFILSGQLPPGTKLPSVRALAKDLACSVITTRRAYQDLEGEGFIRTRQGMGTVVAEIAAESMSKHRREPVESAFEEAVRAGKRAGFSEGELRGIFEETLERNTNLEGGT
ncbi:MAG: GntR family transcriptional regulator [Rubrobacteraceae bacterium]